MNAPRAWPASGRTRCHQPLLTRFVVVAAMVLVASAGAGCSHTVQIKSVPEGADVTLDGEKVGKTPYSFEAGAGFFDDRHLKIESEGYGDFETDIVQSEPIWPIVAPSVCLAPLTLGGSCFGLCWGFRYAKTYEYEMSPIVSRGDGGHESGTAFEDDKNADPGKAIPY